MHFKKDVDPANAQDRIVYGLKKPPTHRIELFTV